MPGPRAALPLALLLTLALAPSAASAAPGSALTFRQPAWGFSFPQSTRSASLPRFFGRPGGIVFGVTSSPSVAAAKTTDGAASEAAAAPTQSTSAAPDAGPASEPTTAGVLFFPGQPTVPQAVANDNFVPECDGVPYMARNADTDRCQFLMLQTDCADGQWFILDKATREAACRPRPCPANEVLFDGACQPRDADGLCPPGMVVLVDEYGEASCDCAVRHVYWPATDSCYPAYRQGPCSVGQYLTVTDAGVLCTPNVCVRDGSALWPETLRCYRLRDEQDSPCEFGRLDVGEETLQLECVDTQLSAIFDLPVVRCSRGSKLDYRGRCKRELHQKFRSTLIARLPGAGDSRKPCKTGFIRAPSGRCLKASGSEALG